MGLTERAEVEGAFVEGHHRGARQRIRLPDNQHASVLHFRRPRVGIVAGQRSAEPVPEALSIHDQGERGWCHPAGYPQKIPLPSFCVTSSVAGAGPLLVIVPAPLSALKPDVETVQVERAIDRHVGRGLGDCTADRHEGAAGESGPCRLPAESDPTFTLIGGLEKKLIGVGRGGVWC